MVYTHTIWFTHFTQLYRGPLVCQDSLAGASRAKFDRVDSVLSLNSSLRARWPLASIVPQRIPSVSSSDAQQRQPTAQAKSSESSFSTSLRPKSWKICRRLCPRCSQASCSVPLRVGDPNNTWLAFDKVHILWFSFHLSCTTPQQSHYKSHLYAPSIPVQLLRWGIRRVRERASILDLGTSEPWRWWVLGEYPK